MRSWLNANGRFNQPKPALKFWLMLIIKPIKLPSPAFVQQKLRAANPRQPKTQSSRQYAANP
jgi:hypothetical protein